MLRAGIISSFLTACALLCACYRLPDSYPPPEQRHPVSGANLKIATLMVDMDAPDASAHIVKDILDGHDSWRWTGKHPTVRELLLTTQDVKFSTDFTLWDQAMKQTGPVTISFFIGDRLLDSVRYDTPGYKHFEKPVPPDWLQTVTDTLISAEIDKIYVAPQDGAKFGFILSRMGFTR
ncbi:MAG: hypothetical protein M3O35_15055 [Acidobacteriota bacterium]|nr:hypothetical protein [Acidobacteriota bacterium]